MAGMNGFLGRSSDLMEGSDVLVGVPTESSGSVGTHTERSPVIYHGESSLSNMNEAIRAFIAIELNKEIHDILSRIQNELKESRADAKWVKPENIHLTLKFLGNINVKQSEEIKKVISDTTSSLSEFDIDLCEIGAFPRKENPRVIWVSIEKNKNILKSLVEILEEKIASVGIPKEDRVFQAHITLGRVRSNKNRSELVEKLKNIKLSQKPSFTISKLTLFKSTLTPSGPTYEVIKEAVLKKV